MDSNLTPLRDKLIAGIVSYFLAGITGLIGFFAWFKLRSLQAVLVVNSSITPWAWKAIEISTFMVLGIIWLVLVLFSQYYYQKGIKKGRLWKNFSLVTGIELLVLAFSSLVIMLYIKEEMNPKSIITMVAEGVVGIAFLVLCFRIKK